MYVGAGSERDKKQFIVMQCDKWCGRDVSLGVVGMQRTGNSGSVCVRERERDWRGKGSCNQVFHLGLETLGKVEEDTEVEKNISVLRGA